MSIYRSNNDQIEFTLPKQGYAAFDAASLKDLLVERLSENKVFTDQNYEGSNLNAFIDVISYAYHVLLFYLNETSNESMFSESQIYENINRIVKSLDYRPVGAQSPVLSINAKATDQLLQGTYTIPRYSFIDIGGYRYSLNKDVTFVKNTTEEQSLDQISGNILLYQGTYKEYPTYISRGEPNELMFLVPGEDQTLDHFNIDVYIQEGGDNGSYHMYQPTTSMMFERPTTRSYEIRLNENKRYEVRFGNDVNGRQLQQGDKVMIYYLITEGSVAEVDSNDAVDKSVVQLNTLQFSDLKSSANIKGDGVVYMSQSESDKVHISNSEPSSRYYTGENVEDIRTNAPATFSSQYRLVSLLDYENYVRTNFSNFISDVNVVNNDTYLDNHLRYYYDIGLKSPGLESRVLYNQVQFSSSCNFNNIYLYCVPRLEKTSTQTKRNNYLTSAQKEIMINKMDQTKNITSSPIIMDPVYVAVNLGYRSTGETLDTSITDNTSLLIVQEDTSRANSNDIIQKVVSIFNSYFDTTTAKIGMNIDIADITNQILNIKGVSTFYTYRTDQNNNYVEGLSMMIWNPVHKNDILQTTQNIRLPGFKFPFFTDIEQLGGKMKVTRASDTSTILGTTTTGGVPVASTNIIDTSTVDSNVSMNTNNVQSPGSSSSSTY
jgi:hypothetical protein